MKNDNRFCFFILVISLLFLSCEKTDKFENQWYSLDSNLKINKDRTFEFERFNSISSSISKGEWKIINDTLVLNSFENKGCYFYENYVLEPLNKIINKNKNCQPNQGYVNFKNEKFYIKDSILIYKSQKNIDESILRNSYSFSRKNRYRKL
ncbi:hypothetical protein [Flavobacterium seoulense]|uniref:Uncharacterized protein n=1 Tax=Flavobacterium seoulense TaxID=1492738 RepID=A0A066WI73_9FLAO|nr:hypothetical protein [Flavobacterium seoulense]KDN53717.1 hypothetical protein FEM21_31660 [Flavobacterium seoulense]